MFEDADFDVKDCKDKKDGTYSTRKTDNSNFKKLIHSRLGGT